MPLWWSHRWAAHPILKPNQGYFLVLVSAWQHLTVVRMCLKQRWSNHKALVDFCSVVEGCLTAWIFSFVNGGRFENCNACSCKCFVFWNAGFCFLLFPCVICWISQRKIKMKSSQCFMLGKASTVSFTKVCFELAWALILVKACSLHIWTHNFHSDHWLFSHRSTVPPEG